MINDKTRHSAVTGKAPQSVGREAALRHHLAMLLESQAVITDYGNKVTGSARQWLKAVISTLCGLLRNLIDRILAGIALKPENVSKAVQTTESVLESPRSPKANLDQESVLAGIQIILVELVQHTQKLADSVEERQLERELTQHAQELGSFVSTLSQMTDDLANTTHSH